MSNVRATLVCVLAIAIAASPLSGSAFAADEPAAATPAPLHLTLPSSALDAPSTALDTSSTALEARPLAFAPSFADMASSDVMAQRGRYRGGRYGGGRGRSGAAEALIIGAAAAIAGAAILAYANRPECDASRYASGCGYGTKVVGTSVLAGGVVGIAVGAALWR